VNIKRYGKLTIFYQFGSLKNFLSYLFRPKKWRFVKREIRYFFQRLRRGWDDSETWNLDKEISEFIYPRLKRYFEVTITAPPYEDGNLKQLSDEEWKEIQDKILFAFNEIRLEGEDPYGFDKDWDKIKEGLDLFHKYRNTFWW